MADSTPTVVELSCPGCQTAFRLRPTKSRLPTFPIPCPRCGTNIEPTEEQLADLKEATPEAPQAQVLRRRSSAGSEPKTPPNLEEVATQGDDETAQREGDTKSGGAGAGRSRGFERDAKTAQRESATVPRKPSPSHTLLGMPLDEESDSSGGTAADPSPKKPPTGRDLSGDETLETDLSDVTGGDVESPDRLNDRLSPPSDDRETSETSAASERSGERNHGFRRGEAPTRRQSAPGEDNRSESGAAKPPSDSRETSPSLEATPGSGSSKLKETRPNPPASDGNGSDEENSDSSPPPTPPASKKASSSKSGKKPSLSELLKKVREKKSRGAAAESSVAEDDGETGGPRIPDLGEESEGKLVDRLFGAIESPRAVLGKQNAPTDSDDGDDAAGEASQAGEPEEVSDESRSENSMLSRVRELDKDRDNLGAASERRGSGYIRLPTTEIMDVLGSGRFRLRVEDIVYEPVDEKGLVKLIKGGVLMGAEEIAEEDGDWMPINEHPVFIRLRQKMAEEAHRLLEEVAAGAPATSSEEEISEPPPLPRPVGGENSEISGFPEESASARGTTKQMFGVDASEATSQEEISEPPPLPGTPSEVGDEPSGAETADAASEAVEEEEEASEPEIEETSDEREEADAETETQSTTESAQPDSVEGPAAKPPRRRRRWPVVVLLLLGVLGAGVAYGIMKGVTFSELKEIVATRTAAPDDAKEKDDETPASSVGPAVEAASSAVAEAGAIDLSEDNLLALANEHDAPAVAAAIHREEWTSEKSAENARALLDALMAAGEFAEARRLVIEAIEITDDDAPFIKAFRRSIEKQWDKERAPTAITQDNGFTALAGVDRQRRPGIRLTRADGSAVVFKPARANDQEDWQSEVAAYRLCQIVACQFHIPKTVPAFLPRTEFDALVDAAPEDVADLVAEQTRDLEWDEENGAEGVAGALQDAVAEPVPYPIEYTGLWRQWLSASEPRKQLEEPLETAIEELKRRKPDLYQEILNRRDDATTRRLARQLSGVLLFDYLTNNWARFENDESRYGQNLRFSNGDIFSIDNSGTFQPRASTRVKGRFSWTSRFSRDMLASVRLLDPDVVDPALFPDADAAARARLEVFWRQRDRALARARGLASRYGEENVLTFE